MNGHDRRRIEKQAVNLMVAQAMMQDIPGRHVYPRLFNWSRGNVEKQTCGSAACFGGYVAIHPYFKKQGVSKDADGAPKMRGIPWAADVAARLFGDETLFEYQKPWEEGPAKKVVLRRICNALSDRLNELEKL